VFVCLSAQHDADRDAQASLAVHDWSSAGVHGDGAYGLQVQALGGRGSVPIRCKHVLMVQESGFGRAGRHCAEGMPNPQKTGPRGRWLLIAWMCSYLPIQVVVLAFLDSLRLLSKPPLM
jgi:hypothetical protein